MPVEREESFDAERCCLLRMEYSVILLCKYGYMKFYEVRDTMIR